MKTKYDWAVILSGTISGFTGIFRRYLATIGIDSFGFAFIRCSVGAIAFAIAILVLNPKELLFKSKDLWLFVVTGLICFLGFNLCYFQAMTVMSLSAAAVLLYSAPAFVVLFSFIIFKEPITPKKIVSVALAVFGCMLASGIVSGQMNFSYTGLLFGIGSGIGYAFFSIFCKILAQKGYTSNTINFWSCVFATIGLTAIKIESPNTVLSVLHSQWLMYILIGLITCYLPYSLYTYGLSKLNASRVSVIVSVEPVVATIVGGWLYQEKIDFWICLGIIMVLSAIVILNIGTKNRNLDF